VTNEPRRKQPAYLDSDKARILQTEMKHRQTDTDRHTDRQTYYLNQQSRISLKNLKIHTTPTLKLTSDMTTTLSSYGHTGIL